MKYEDGELYHVYNRGAHKSRIFFGVDNYRFLVRLAEKYRAVNKTQILAYCFMPNHYHFLLRQAIGGSSSKFLQNSFNSYTQAVNLQQKHSGTLFQGRAKANHVVTDLDALIIARYIHLNPVSAHLVSSPDAWEFSDYRLWCGATVVSPDIMSLRGSEFKDGVEYAQFVLDRNLDLKNEVTTGLLGEEAQ